MSKLLKDMLGVRPQGQATKINDNNGKSSYVTAKDIAKKHASAHGANPAYESQVFLQTDTLRFQSAIDEWFIHQNDKGPPRIGTHASDILSYGKGFCFRENILMEKTIREHPNLLKREEISPSLLRIFSQGNYMHQKWQDLFRSAHVVEYIEQAFYSKRYDLYFTPDAVIKFSGRTYVVEIKSMNSMSYSRLSGPPRFAVEQCMLYMHLLGYGYGIVLVEDKDRQAYMPWVVSYDPEYVKPYLVRIRRLIRFRQSGDLPSRICKKIKEKRALACPVRELCFAEE